ncbi:MAG: ribosome small subunit-dependent GTPase A [Lachnospiraceae bacterium]|nr:ribosome small subunit-dependent GTPase A [Lachnospiraceae bacterium]
MAETLKGKIIKGVGGKYSVRTDVGDLICHAKGILRHKSLKPLIGDDCVVELLPDEPGCANLIDILPRKNELIRPAVANIDGALIEFAVKDPAPSLNLLDRFLILMEKQNIPVIICVNKIDIDRDNICGKITDIYTKIGYKVFPVSTYTREGIDALKAEIYGKTTVWAGPSGVGKSSLINMLSPEALMETGEISKKIGRGKNTTRHTQLLCCEGDTFVLDTPGFSSIELFDIEAEDLMNYFEEFSQFIPECRFSGCIHIGEKQCAVKEHVGRDISQDRYDNYVLFYNELKSRRKY